MTPETIRASAGEEFEIRLESTPTTGYMWEVVQLPENVALLRAEFEPATGQPQAGAPGFQLFRFLAQQAGEYRIKFVLKRQWEHDGIRSQTVKLEVN